MSELPEASHAAQQREYCEPSESLRPVPLVVVIVTLAAVLFGAAYILLSDPFGPSGLGDQRTLADLRPVAKQAGQADDANGAELLHDGLGLRARGSDEDAELEISHVASR